VEAYLANLTCHFESLLAVITTGSAIQIISRVLHILSAIILVGGLFYIRTILSPAGLTPAGGSSPEDMNRACFADRRVIWAKWVGISTAFLLVSGFYNFFMILAESKVEGAAKLPPTYHMLFGIKFLLALVVMFVSAILSGKTKAADRFRGNMRKWLNIGWFAALGIIVIAAILRTLH